MLGEDRREGDLDRLRRGDLDLERENRLGGDRERERGEIDRRRYGRGDRGGEREDGRYSSRLSRLKFSRGGERWLLGKAEPRPPMM